MAPHLLTLPAEIRNMIYEFALTEENGIRYIEDADGIGRLCVYDENDCSPKGPIVFEDSSDDFDHDNSSSGDDSDSNARNDNDSNNDGFDSDDSESEENDSDENDVTSDHGSYQNQQGRPANEVKSFGNDVELEAFPSNIDLVENTKCLSGTDSLVRLKFEGSIIVNQLQFVCHRLQKETRGLVLRHNDIVFSERGIGNSAKLCVSFVRSLPENLEPLLKTLRIITVCGWFNSDIDPLVALCRKYPTVSVHLRNVDAPYQAEKLMVTANSCEVSLGKKTNLLTKLGSKSRSDLRGWWSFLNWTHLPQFNVKDCPDNFRIFPGATQFNEAKFRRDANKSGSIGIVLSGLEGGMDTLVAAAKDYIENGW